MTLREALTKSISVIPSAAKRSREPALSLSKGTLRLFLPELMLREKCIT